MSIIIFIVCISSNFYIKIKRTIWDRRKSRHAYRKKRTCPRNFYIVSIRDTGYTRTWDGTLIFIPSFCDINSFFRDIEFNSRNSIRAKSIFACYIFYYIKNNNLFQNIKVLFCLVIESLKMIE